MTLWQAKLAPLRFNRTLFKYEKVSSPWLPFHNLSTEVREKKKGKRQKERPSVVKQEKLEIKEQCFISQRVCLSSVTYNGRGQPPAQRGPSSPISPRLHLLLKHNRVSLQCEPPVSHKAPERVIRALGCLLLPEPDRLPQQQRGGQQPRSPQPLRLNVGWRW